jgi:putative membrane protein
MGQPEPKLGDVLAQNRTDLAQNRTDLAGDRTDLAVERTLMAAQRTLMAWVRTGLSMIGFGFTIYKVLQAMLKEGIQLTPHIQGPRNIGLFLIALGTLSTFMGSLDYWILAKDIHKRSGSPIRKYPLVMAGLIFLLGLWLFVSIILKAELF